MTIKKIKIFIQEKFNFVYRIYIKFVLRSKLQDEINFFQNKYQISSKSKSIILFTTHKSASTFFDKFFFQFKKNFNKKYLNFDYYNTYFGGNTLHKNSNFLVKNFLSRGIIYGPIRSPIKLKSLEKFKIILFVRDPRDILISDYFSKKYSHNIINKKFLNQKKEAKKLDLDTYVLKNAKIYLRIFNQYISLFTLSDFTLIKYNTMINNPKRFQSLLVEIFDLDQSKKEIKNFFKKELKQDFKKNNYSSHRKTGTINIYKKFLKQKTILKLNKIYKPILLKYKF